MSTASDRPEPDQDPAAPPSLTGQYVGCGTALHGVSAHHITIYGSSPGSSQVPSRVAPGVPAAGRYQALGRLRRLTSRLAVLADRIHAAAEVLAGMPVPSENVPPHASCRCFSSASDADRPRRNA
ncbi:MULTISPECIES: hypothetical protein [Streptomyces]|uniref:hypothetical protein n=1 Tax=Streptomyces TaxID=1883 RepID=UPI0033CF84CE